MRKSIHTAQYRTFLRELIQAREGVGVTQVELAKRLRVGQSAISKVERGERRLDAVELYSWCRALKVPFREFTARLDERLRGT